MARLWWRGLQPEEAQPRRLTVLGAPDELRGQPHRVAQPESAAGDPHVASARYDAVMRTTINLPDDLHRAAFSLARDRGQSLSQTVSELVRRALLPATGSAAVDVDARTGLPVVRLGTPVTTEMVRAAADEEE